jgi:hypothetical protein
MVRVGDAIIISQMAGHARGRQAIVNVVFVARSTAYCDVGAREREWRIAMIKSRP